MPTKIPVIYPRYARIYPRYAGAPMSRGGIRQPAAGRGGSKGGFGNQVDTSSTGNVGGDLAKAIINTMQANRQNAAANALMNQGPTGQPGGGITQNLGRLPTDGGSQDLTMPENTGLGDTVGSLIHTGGVGELQMRQQQDQQALADQLQKAKIASQLALAQQRTGRGGGTGTAGGNAQRWTQYLGGGDGGTGQSGRGGGKAGKAPAYDVGSDANTNLDADKFPNLAADFDARYGKGAYAKVAPSLANIAPQKDEKGNPTGNFVLNDTKGNPALVLGPQDAGYWISRYNAASVRAGQPTLPNPGIAGANPNSGQDLGTETNPYVPKNQLEARSLPYNKYMKDPNTGQIGLKLPPDQGQGGQAGQPQGGQKTSAVDFTGGDQTQVAQNTQPPPLQGQDQPTGQIPTIVPPVGQFGASRPDMNTGIGLDQTAGAAPQDTGSQGLADAITKARIVAQLQGTT